MNDDGQTLRGKFLFFSQFHIFNYFYNSINILHSRENLSNLCTAPIKKQLI